MCPSQRRFPTQHGGRRPRRASPASRPTPIAPRPRAAARGRAAERHPTRSPAPQLGVTCRASTPTRSRPKRAVPASMSRASVVAALRRISPTSRRRGSYPAYWSCFDCSLHPAPSSAGRPRSPCPARRASGRSRRPCRVGPAWIRSRRSPWLRAPTGLPGRRDSHAPAWRRHAAHVLPRRMCPVSIRPRRIPTRSGTIRPGAPRGWRPRREPVSLGSRSSRASFAQRGRSRPSRTARPTAARDVASGWAQPVLRCSHTTSSPAR